MNKIVIDEDFEFECEWLMNNLMLLYLLMGILFWIVYYFEDLV